MASVAGGFEAIASASAIASSISRPAGTTRLTRPYSAASRAVSSELLEVVPGAEGGALGGDDNGAHACVVRRAVDRCLQRSEHPLRQAVAPLRTREREHEHAAAALTLDLARAGTRHGSPVHR